MRLLFALVLLAVCACVVRDPPPPLTGVNHPLIGLQNFDFSLKRYPDGATVALSSLRGKVVMIDVWATWCEPCRDSLPLYSDLQRQYGPKGLVVVALNVDADASQIPKFLAETKVDVTVVMDPDAAFAESVLKVKVMPTALFIDKKGTVRSVHEGFAEEFLGKSISEIEMLLAEPAQ